MKKNKIFQNIMAVVSMFLAILVFAGTQSAFIWLVLSAHSSLFFLYPLAKLFGIEKQQKIFSALFALRALLYVLFGTFAYLDMIDGISIFIGGFFILPFTDRRKTNKEVTAIKKQENVFDVKLKCKRCGCLMTAFDSKCPKCGLEVSDNNVSVYDTTSEKSGSVPEIKEYAKLTMFPDFYKLDEDELVTNFINKEISRLGINFDGNKRKNTY